MSVTEFLTGWRWALVVSYLFANLVYLYLYLRSRLIIPAASSKESERSEPASDSSESLRARTAWQKLLTPVAIVFLLTFVLLLPLAPLPPQPHVSPPNTDTALLQLQRKTDAQSELLRHLADEQEKLALILSQQNASQPPVAQPPPASSVNNWEIPNWLLAALLWIVGGSFVLFLGLWSYFNARAVEENKTPTPETPRPPGVR